MSLASVREFLAQRAPDIPVIEMETSTATVELAAAAHGVEPGQIAKTLSLRVGEAVLLVVLGGDVRMDNKKLRHTFGGKAKMLDAQSVRSEEHTSELQSLMRISYAVFCLKKQQYIL